MLRRTFLGTLVVLWLAALFTGGRLLLGYQALPGPANSTTAAWPADSRLRRDTERYSVLLFVHPRCPCTQASIDELAWLLARSGERVDTWAVFVVPEGAPTDWQKGRSWEAAGAVPGLQKWTDLGGTEAQRFGVVTSGHVAVFAPDGRVVFSGGITGARGHRGENPGRNAAHDALLGRHVEGNWPVFGCPLFRQDSESVEGRSK
jgi:hypothetical protein